MPFFSSIYKFKYQFQIKGTIDKWKKLIASIDYVDEIFQIQRLFQN